MPLKPAILLDSNAGAPLHPVVKRALLAFLDAPSFLGNPSSTHAFGRAGAKLLAEAEASILSTFRVTPREWAVTFTGSGTEGNQLAVRTVLQPFIKERGEAGWVTSDVEHSCVRDLIPEIERSEVLVRTLRPETTGEVKEFGDALHGAKLLSMIGVGNETGIIQEKITSHILSRQFPSKTSRPVYHVDYVAGWGKSELDLSVPGAPDLVAISGHKLGGLSGSGALIRRKYFKVDRPGTPNLAGIVAMKALADQWGDLVGESRGLGALRDLFERELHVRFPRAVVTGEGLPRVPNVSHFYFPNLSRDLSLVEQLDFRGFAVSAGSACASHARQASHVLLAMGIPDLDARNALRVSLHPGNTSADIFEFLDALSAILKRNEIE